MTTSAQRFYIRSPDGRMIVGFDDLNAAGAVARGKADVVELLITYGADVNARDAEGTSALDLALERSGPVPHHSGAPAQNDVSLKTLPWIARHESSQIILSGRPYTGHDGANLRACSCGGDDGSLSIQ